MKISTPLFNYAILYSNNENLGTEVYAFIKNKYLKEAKEKLIKLIEDDKVESVAILRNTRDEIVSIGVNCITKEIMLELEEAKELHEVDHLINMKHLDKDLIKMKTMDISTEKRFKE